jgi:hypothetical protein
MSLWFRSGRGINSEIMRDAASNADVSWNHQIIQYKKQGVAYKCGSLDDAGKIKGELEKLLGYRPVEIDEPTVDINTNQPSYEP